MAPPVQFTNPPVAEVVCGVMFNTLPKFMSGHVGLLWQRFRTAYPRLVDAAPLDPVIEAPEQAGGAIQIEYETLPPMRRSWFLSADGSELVQVQPDRFLFNWKRVPSTDSYPSYAKVSAKFEQHLKELRSFLSTEDLGELEFRQFELTYVNLIGPENGLKDISLEDALVDHQRCANGPRFLPRPEAFQWNTSYPLPNNEGRLHLNARTISRIPKKDRILRLDLTARGVTHLPSDQERNRWFAQAHDWITFGFADCTSPRLQKDHWGRII
jgi:uncharacterized protein (TIGR04255 family)